jgi:hypothetical protein
MVNRFAVAWKVLWGHPVVYGGSSSNEPTTHVTVWINGNIPNRTVPMPRKGVTGL